MRSSNRINIIPPEDVDKIIKNHQHLAIEQNLSIPENLNKFKKHCNNFKTAYEDYLNQYSGTQALEAKYKQINRQFEKYASETKQKISSVKKQWMNSPSDSDERQIYNAYREAKDAYREKLNEILQSDDSNVKFIKMYKTGMELQNTLNDFMDTEIDMVVVSDDGKISKITEQSILAESLSDALSSNLRHIGRLSFSKKQLQSKKNLFPKKSLSREEKQSMDNISNVYREVIRRYNIAKQNNTNMVLWLNGNKWYGQQVYSLGDIKETYVWFMEQALHQDKLLLSGDIHSQVAQFVQQTSLVDNLQGITRADVEYIEQWLDEDGNIIKTVIKGYAVKSNGATMASYTTLYKLAQKVVINPNMRLNTLLRMISKNFIDKTGAQRKTAAAECVNAVNEKMINEIMNPLYNLTK